ncbi:unnamed protein product [Miscanthus lutarioriparius]|uniref:RING-type E3 ubiquitin transferase n=1 Tax=Miscanthus lutarioriparius TaxID=422564 RepID=A0A811P2L1_9POAL|nr:unnamed protein product [Miscanthus lutarioriparius]
MPPQRSALAGNQSPPPTSVARKPRCHIKVSLPSGCSFITAACTDCGWMRSRSHHLSPLRPRPQPPSSLTPWLASTWRLHTSVRRYVYEVYPEIIDNNAALQCINGHAVRCRPVQNMLAEMNTLCKFSNYGCAEIIKFVQKRTHEESCRHAPYGYVPRRRLQLPRHEHGSVRARRRCLLRRLPPGHHGGAPQERALPPAGAGRQPDMRKLFLLRNGGDIQALARRSLYLVCLGPRPEGDVDIKYKMEVRGADGDGGALSLLGTAPCIRELEDLEANKFLFVPDAYWGPSASVSVSVRIG